MSILTKRYFHNEKAAFKKLESVLWPDGPVCPHCGGMDSYYDLSKTRVGLKKCGHCRKQFTVRIGTVYERSHIPLHKWLQATFLMCSSKKGISAHQLHRMLDITYKSAWFMCHRIREGMREANPAPMGGSGQVVEADETFLGGRKKRRPKTVWINDKGWRKRGGTTAHAMKIISLVERDGRARSVHVKSLTANTARDILRLNVVRKTTKLITDESNIYKKVGREYESHESVNHGKYEWGRGEVHTNTIEGFFSIFKRGMRGVYQHCSEAHLQRYLHEFDFRYSHRKITDSERVEMALVGVVGKRLTYQQSSQTTDT